MKLTKEDIPKIRALLNKGVSQQKIAEKFGVSHRIIGGILSGKRRAHV